MDPLLIDLDSFAKENGIAELAEFEREIRWGVHARQVTAHFRQEQHARAMQGHTPMEEIGQCSAVIDATAYHYWGQRLGYECWQDDEFLKEIKRDNPATRVKAEPRKTTIIVP